MQLEWHKHKNVTVRIRKPTAKWKSTQRSDDISHTFSSGVENLFQNHNVKQKRRLWWTIFFSQKIRLIIVPSIRHNLQRHLNRAMMVFNLIWYLVNDFFRCVYLRFVFLVHIPQLSHTYTKHHTYTTHKHQHLEYATVGYMAKRIQMRKQRFMAIQKIAQEKKLQVDGGQQPSAMMSAGPDHSHSHSSHGHSHSHQHGPKQSVQQTLPGTIRHNVFFNKLCVLHGICEY